MHLEPGYLGPLIFKTILLNILSKFPLGKLYTSVSFILSSSSYVMSIFFKQTTEPTSPMPASGSMTPIQPLLERTTLEPFSSPRPLPQLAVLGSPTSRIPLPVFADDVKALLSSSEIHREYDRLVEQAAYHILGHGDMTDRGQYEEFGRQMCAAYPCIAHKGERQEWVREIS